MDKLFQEKSSAQIRDKRGRFATDKQCHVLAVRSMNGKRRKAIVTQVSDVLDQKNIENTLDDGYRIVHKSHLTKQMKCLSCNATLSFSNEEQETKIGLASILSIRCAECLLLNKVSTGPQYDNTNNGYKVFDINSRLVLGALHTGIGHQQTSNLLATMNIPQMSQGTFKKHERYLTSSIDAVTADGFEEAVRKERAFTLEKVEEMEKYLPEHLKGTNFILPSGKNPRDILPTDIVRIYVSYDMGWSKRGNRRQYNSMNGYGALIGYFSGLVLDVETLNCACRFCDKGAPVSSHDCRKNYEGTAKGMEGVAAKKLVVHSSVLKKFNVEVGIFAGDNDSSSIHAIRQEAKHFIVKADDLNHAKKGVKNLLYSLYPHQDPLKELTNLPSKEYLRRCFACAVEQNKGDAAAMKEAIRNIPHHAFNIHDKCGDWCDYTKDTVNYQHKSIPGGFKSEELYKSLTDLYNKVAENADKFAAGASSQANESLNHIITRKAPKNNFYCSSESADDRVKCAVNQKNFKYHYIGKILKKTGIEPGKNLYHRNNVCTEKYLQYSKRSKQPSQKLKRRLNITETNAKRRKKESTEINTYQSNMTLLCVSNLPPVDASQNIGSFFQCSLPACLEKEVNSDINVVYFDLETSGLSYYAEILQIALKCNELSYKAYITPCKPISFQATQVHGLTQQYGQLFLKNKPVFSSPKRVVMGEVIAFLKSLNKPSILIGHNVKCFDIPRLILTFYNVSMLDELFEVIVGFTDTLLLFQEKFPERKNKKNQLTLVSLVDAYLQLPFDAHDAYADICALEKLTNRFFSHNFIIENKFSLNDAALKLQFSLRAKENIKTYQPLKNIVSDYIINKLAQTGVTFDIIKQKFINDGEIETGQFIKQLKVSNSKSKANKSQFIKDESLQLILDYLKKNTVNSKSTA